MKARRGDLLLGLVGQKREGRLLGEAGREGR